MIFITRKAHFCAAHQLWNPDWTAEKNKSIFGDCAHENGHGHNYTLYVTVKGQIDLQTGFVMNLKRLKVLMKDLVLSKVDHRNLNIDVDFLQGKITTTENVCVAIWEVLKDPILKEGAFLHEVKLIETENNFVSYFGSTL